jgi:hypothetical protein
LDAGIRALKPSYQTFFASLDTLYWQYKPSAEARTSTVSILRDLSFQRLTFLAGAASRCKESQEHGCCGWNCGGKIDTQRILAWLCGHPGIGEWPHLADEPAVRPGYHLSELVVQYAMRTPNYSRSHGNISNARLLRQQFRTMNSAIEEFGGGCFELFRPI